MTGVTDTNSRPRTMKAFWFVYEDNDERGQTRAVIRIRAKRKPGPNTVPRSGAWVLREWVPYTHRDGLFTETRYKWQMPCFPEITWARLSKMRLARKVEHDHQ